MRDELFRRIGAGEVVPESEWDVIADAQRALDDEVFLPSGYMRGLL